MDSGIQCVFRNTTKKISRSPHLEIHVHLDASSVVVGVVLVQIDDDTIYHPNAYAIQKLKNEKMKLFHQIKRVIRNDIFSTEVL
jgi:hypothetical protein